MEILLAVVLAVLLIGLGLKLLGLLLRGAFGMLLWCVKVLFVMACLLSVAYFAIQLLPTS